MAPHILAGYGAFGGDRDIWLKTYPCWPQKFGIPGSTNAVSLFQGVAYRTVFEELDGLPIEEDTVTQRLSDLSKECAQDLIIVGQAPLTDLTRACQEDPDLLKRCNRIVMMGGWFTDNNGDFLRLGYNTAVDLRSAKHILTQSDVPVLIVSSELVKKFPLTDRERAVFELSKCKTPLGEAVGIDMHNYWANKKPPKGNLGLADILTSYLAQHPEAIDVTQPVRLTFNDELVEANIDMFDPQAKNLIKVEPEETSNIHVITAVKDAEQLRISLVSEIAAIFYPNVSPEIFQKIVANLEAVGEEATAQQLNYLNGQ
jgi:hypothetical protein